MPKGTKKELTTTGEKRLKTLMGRLRSFRDYKQISPEALREFEYKVKNSVINASDQARYALRLIGNAKTNAGRARTFEELLADELPPTAPPAPIAGPSSSKSSKKSSKKWVNVSTMEEGIASPSSSSSSSKSSRKSKGKERVEMSAELEEDIKKQLGVRKSLQVTTPATSIYVPSESDDGNVPTEARDHMMIDETIEEPKLSQSQLKHIKDVVKILEKQPALKTDIRRTIVEELTKGYINPEQFKEYNQAIEDIAIKEAPTAVRARKTPKPRAKKSQQSDKAIIPMEIEQTSKLPKGKEIKNTQNKK